MTNHEIGKILLNRALRRAEKYIGLLKKLEQSNLYYRNRPLFLNRQISFVREISAAHGEAEGIFHFFALAKHYNNQPIKGVESDFI